MKAVDKGVASVEEVRKHLAKPGPHRWSGRVSFAGPPLQGWSWPLTILRGSRDGPTVTVIGGTHGAEYVGVLTVLELARDLKPEGVRGTLCLLPVLDLPSFWAKVPFVCPLDGKDPAACFPGRSDGTFTEVMCQAIWDLLLEPSQAILDLHGGDICESLLPFTIMQLTGDEDLDRRTERAARAFELPYLVVRPIETSRTLSRHLAVAGARGKVAIVAEVGGAGDARPGDVQLMREGVLRSLGCLGTLTERPYRPDVSRACRVARVLAEREGVITYDVELGATVTAGQLLGRISDLAGEYTDELRAPVAGVVLFMNRVPAATKGTIMFGVEYGLS